MREGFIHLWLKPISFSLSPLLYFLLLLPWRSRMSRGSPSHLALLLLHSSLTTSFPLTIHHLLFCLPSLAVCSTCQKPTVVNMWSLGECVYTPGGLFTHALTIRSMQQTANITRSVNCKTIDHTHTHYSVRATTHCMPVCTSTCHLTTVISQPPRVSPNRRPAADQ